MSWEVTTDKRRFSTSVLNTYMPQEPSRTRSLGSISTVHKMNTHDIKSIRKSVDTYNVHKINTDDNISFVCKCIYCKRRWCVRLPCPAHTLSHVALESTTAAEEKQGWMQLRF